MSGGSHSEKFNIVSNDHGRTQKSDFCVSVGKTNFTNHHTADAISGFRDSVLVCKMTTATVQRGKISSIFIPSHQAMQAQSDCHGLQIIWKQTTSKCSKTYLALHILIQVV